jgi:hypothetical protein
VIPDSGRGHRKSDSATSCRCDRDDKSPAGSAAVLSLGASVARRVDIAGVEVVVQPKKRHPGQRYSSESIFRSHRWIAAGRSAIAGVVSSTIHLQDSIDVGEAARCRGMGWTG